METITNQKHASTTKGVQGKRFDQGGNGGGVNPIVSAVIENKKMEYDKINQ